MPPPSASADDVEIAQGDGSSSVRPVSSGGRRRKSTGSSVPSTMGGSRRSHAAPPSVEDLGLVTARAYLPKVKLASEGSAARSPVSRK